MSHGARTCPFFTLTILPVAAAATSRSVCRHRKAGICSTSTAYVNSQHFEASWPSVSTGMPSHVDALRGFVDIGQHGHAQRLADLFKPIQPISTVISLMGGHAGAVGLVER